MSDYNHLCFQYIFHGMYVFIFNMLYRMQIFGIHVFTYAIHRIYIFIRDEIPVCVFNRELNKSENRALNIY